MGKQEAGRSGGRGNCNWDIIYERRIKNNNFKVRRKIKHKRRKKKDLSKSLEYLKYIKFLANIY